MERMTASQSQNPITRFKSWMEDAERSEPEDPTAVALATATPAGVPSVRMVLLKGVDDRGFVYYTNLASRKAREMTANPHVALCFHWKSLTRQVRIEGRVEAVDDAEADAYFATRQRLSQIGAWASKQSQPLVGRLELEKRVAEYTARFNFGSVPRPEFWSGFRLVPERIEFWKSGQFRLHDREVFTRDGEGWATEKLYP